MKIWREFIRSFPPVCSSRSFHCWGTIQLLFPWSIVSSCSWQNTTRLANSKLQDLFPRQISIQSLSQACAALKIFMTQWYLCSHLTCWTSCPESTGCKKSTLTLSWVLNSEHWFGYHSQFCTYHLVKVVFRKTALWIGWLAALNWSGSSFFGRTSTCFLMGLCKVA